MKVRTFKHELELATNAPGYIRSPGLHMSDLYGSLYKDIDPDRYDKRNPDGTPEEMDKTKVAAGTAFEQHLEPILAARYGGERPGEFFTQHSVACRWNKRPVRDGSIICACGAGIAYSPDWLFFFPEMVLGEFKFSWYSCRDFPHHQKFDKWKCQCKVYLYHLRGRKVWVFPYWVNGIYPRGAPSPLFDDAYELEFTQRELLDEWMALLQHGQQKGLIPK